ncbi:dihydrofolate reductase family protein [Pseudovibrio sp. Tun.PSC04-5.I4]|uniref:dihydrofolate reductase family protein n=1 Tax=Pseudovibrio sp. Tun.PSC04-5.I4 TaxID=1798213 RepID=UPI000885EA7D|nr:dihydrofolate reductase family protein [Pseudovibrio sp. Tun.PSC04-5.I4]SDR32311.1 Dihydrofolate reductase [Pseudovibrio sp. Tun.PSC04-5.I4]
MATGHVFIATTLDGFVAREDHALDWLMKQSIEGEDHGYDEFVGRMDGIVMGRGSYEAVLGFENWPYKKPVVVLSKTLTRADVPDALKGKVRVTASDPAQVMKELEAEGWSHAYVDGGKVVQSFIRAGLVDDIVLTQIPILIGAGLRLFGEIAADIDLELVSSRTFNSGLVQSHYRLATAVDG